MDVRRRLQRHCPSTTLAWMKRLTPRCQTVLITVLTRVAHPRPSPSGLDWSVWDQTDASSRELDDNPDNITRVLKSDKLSLANLSHMASVLLPRRYLRRCHYVSGPRMARVRGIVVDSQYSVKGGVAERAEFTKRPN
jgi:hypothetical protein